MLANFKLKSLKKKLENNLKKRDRSALHSHFKTIAFIFNENEFTAIETLHEITSSLGIEKEHCKVLAFRKYHKNIELKEYEIHHKQIKWNGAIASETAKQFLKLPFDVLIGYYNGEHPYLDFLISESVARFKVGIADSNVNLFDLQIHLKTGEDKALVKELQKYLYVLGKVS